MMALEIETMIREIFGSSSSKERISLWYNPETAEFGILQNQWDICLIDILDLLLESKCKAYLIRDL